MTQGFTRSILWIINFGKVKHIWPRRSRHHRLHYLYILANSKYHYVLHATPNFFETDMQYNWSSKDQITSLMILYSTVYSDADQRKHQSSTSLAFLRGIHRGPVNSPHKLPVTRKMLPFDDVIMRRIIFHGRCFAMDINSLKLYQSNSNWYMFWIITFHVRVVKMILSIDSTQNTFIVNWKCV